MTPSYITAQQWFTDQLANAPLCEKLKKIKLFITDVDGCLTDASVYIFNDGNEAKGFSIVDGYCMKFAKAAGLHIAFISGRAGKATELRGQKLGLDQDHCRVGVDEKISHLTQLQHLHGLSKEETLFLGDDLLDLETRPHIGLFAAPTNGVFYVCAAADLIVPSGGHGAFRLIVDLILYLQGKHPAQELIAQTVGKRH